ncbi:hypothetical protein PENTCL1PPCAC_9096, partial [Pristionchus entomophagus]
EKAYWRERAEREYDPSLPESAKLTAVRATAPKSLCDCPSPFCCLPNYKSLHNPDQDNNDNMDDSNDVEDGMHQGDNLEANIGRIGFSRKTGLPKPKCMRNKRFNNWKKDHRKTFSRIYRELGYKERMVKERIEYFNHLSEIEHAYWSWCTEEEYYPDLPKSEELLAAEATAPPTKDCYCHSP